jgi:hypothetical protein
MTYCPWPPPADPVTARWADHAASSVRDSMIRVEREGYRRGWLHCHRELAPRLAEADRRADRAREDTALAERDAERLRAEVERLQAATVELRRLSGALCLAEAELQSARREVAHLRRLAGLPEGM